MYIFRIIPLFFLVFFSFSTVCSTPQAKPGFVVTGKAESLKIHIPVRGKIDAAVYERGSRTWVVQNSSQFWPLTPLPELKGKAHHQKFVSALSFDTPQGLHPQVKYGPYGIELSFVKLNQVDAQLPDYKKQPISGNIEFNLPIPLHPKRYITLKDDDHGDHLLIVPLKEDDFHIQKALKFVDFELMRTAVGLVFLPHIDDLRLIPQMGAVVVSSDEGLRLAFTTSPEAFIPSPPPLVQDPKILPLAESNSGLQNKQKEVALAESIIKEINDQAQPHKTVQAIPHGTVFNELIPFLRVEEWETNIPFAERLNELQENIYNSGKYLEEEAYNLARFYLTYGLGPEGQNVLIAIQKKNPKAKESINFIGLSGVSALLRNEFYEGLLFISNPIIEKDPRIVTWKWVANFLKSVEEGDTTSVLPGTVRLNHLPHDLKYEVLSRLMKNALQVEDFDNYKVLSEIARFNVKYPVESNYLTYLDGWYNYLTDQIDTAFALWEKVGEEGDRFNSAQSRYAYLYKGMEAAKLTRAEVMEGLEHLAYAWRGDDFEHKTRYKLAKMLIEDEKVREALLQFKALIVQFPTHPQAGEITSHMTEAFTKYMLESPPDLPKIDILAMFEEFKELTPIGERGDQIYLKVANYYMDLSLPAEAAPILQHLAQFKLKGEDKAEAGVKLCTLYMEKQNWEGALQALSISKTTGLPEKMVCERLQLRAQVLLNQKHYQEVITLLKDKNDTEALRIKASAYSGLKKWAEAKKIYAKIIRALPENAPLNSKSQFDVLNYAISLVFEKEFDTLSTVKEKYEPEMKKGLYGQAFSLVSSSIYSNRLQDLGPSLTGLTEMYQQFRAS